MSATKALEFPFATKSITIKGTEYTFREITVEENDECNDAGNGPEGKWDGRAALRMMITKSSVEPKLDFATIARMPLAVYNAVATAVNEVNRGDLEDEDAADPNG